MKPLFAAIRFLTIVAVPSSWAGDETALRRSVAFFPVVGLLIGNFMKWLWEMCVNVFRPRKTR